jgi:hypothetical protein
MYIIVIDQAEVHENYSRIYDMLNKDKRDENTADGR